ncbi:Sec-independent protein translocase protein TatB, partial [Bosea sp. CER48]|uniref:Sec-independent protein translocase protein TatB n=1 Tax=Bosea sp. CER48 TaxID=3377035 RepID=UPI0037FCD8E3
MFDIAWSEMVLIGAVALVVIGPKDLPKALRTVGQTVARVRRMASEFQGQFNEAMREAELADLKKQVEDVGGSVQSALNTDFKPIDQIKDFEAPKPDDAALKEAEAKLASLPAPAPLPPVDIKPDAPK